MHVFCVIYLNGLILLCNNISFHFFFVYPLKILPTLCEDTYILVWTEKSILAVSHLKIWSDNYLRHEIASYHKIAVSNGLKIA